MLEHSHESIDHISLHMYFANNAKHTGNFLALSQKLDAYNGTIESTINVVKANKRSKHKVHISFDEWNVWYHSRAGDRDILGGHAGWLHAPRLLEDVYNFEDVLQVGCIINTFIRRSNIVKIACIAQHVNVIAPIMTEPGGDAWRQTIYYPYYFASIYGRCAALQLHVNCASYDADVADSVPYLDVAGVHNENDGTISFFIINRHATATLDLVVSLIGFGKISILDHQLIKHEHLEAANNHQHQKPVIPKKSNGCKN